MSLTANAASSVGVWKPNTSNTSRNTTTPCGYLVQKSQCPNPGCDFSHEPWRVRAWQSKQAGKECRFGESCQHFVEGHCLFYHPLRHSQSESTREKVIKQDLELLQCLSLASLVVDQDVGIQDKGDLASFNKLSNDEIAVPGCPPRFHPLTEPATVTLDWDNPTLQPSFAKYTHTFEPLLRSIEATDPTFDVLAADVVSNASNLRKLCQIFSQASKCKLVERFDLEWRKNTLFLSKWTGDPSWRSSLGYGTGFERLTCRYADDDDERLRNSPSHHRVVWYNFAGLECVIQSEVDGYFCDCHHPDLVLPPESVAIPATSEQAPINTPTPPTASSKRSKQRHRRIPSSSSSVSTVSLSPSATSTYSKSSPTPTNTKLSRIRQNSTHQDPTRFSRLSSLLSLDDPGDTLSFITTTSSSSSNTHYIKTTPTLKVHHLPGRNIPSPCLIEIKTHKASNRLMFAPEAQLYFCRRTQLSVAQHRAGVFQPAPFPTTTTVDDDGGSSGGSDSGGGNMRQGTETGTRTAGRGGIEDKTADLVKWEGENQQVLGKVAGFLRLLIGKMREMERGRRRDSDVRWQRGLSSGSEVGGIWRGGGRTGDGALGGISVIIEGHGNGKERGQGVKAGLYARRGEGVKSLLPVDF